MSTALSRLLTARWTKKPALLLDEVVYMTADMEDEFIVAQANEPLTEERQPLLSKRVTARYRDEILETERDSGRLYGRFARE